MKNKKGKSLLAEVCTFNGELRMCDKDKETGEVPVPTEKGADGRQVPAVPQPYKPRQ